MSNLLELRLNPFRSCLILPEHREQGLKLGPGSPQWCENPNDWPHFRATEEHKVEIKLEPDDTPALIGAS